MLEKSIMQYAGLVLTFAFGPQPTPEAPHAITLGGELSGGKIEAVINDTGVDTTITLGGKLSVVPDALIDSGKIVSGSFPLNAMTDSDKGVSGSLSLNAMTDSANTLSTITRCRNPTDNAVEDNNFLDITLVEVRSQNTSEFNN